MITPISHYSRSRCGSTGLRKNGHSAEGRPRYHCKGCHFYGTISQVAQQRADRYKQVEKHLLERTSLRGIQRVTGVSRPTISKLIKKK